MIAAADLALTLMRSTRAVKKLCKDSGAVKVLERLSGRGPKFVDDAVEILTKSQASRDSKVNQLFLYDILRHAGPGMVVLCAASRRKQRVMHLAEKDRISLVNYIEAHSPNLQCPSFEHFAEEYSVPSVNGFYNAVLPILRRLTRTRSSPCGDWIQKTYP